MVRFCDGGRTQRSRRGYLTDTAVKTAKWRAAEATLDKVSIGDDALENVLNFDLGSRLQCDGDDQKDTSPQGIGSGCIRLVEPPMD